jgi:hypothetical protein
MHDNLSGRAAELAHLTDLIRTSLSLADAAIPLLDEQLHALAEMGIDNLQLEGPRIYSRTAGWSPTFDDEQIIFAAALTMLVASAARFGVATTTQRGMATRTMSRRCCGIASSCTISFRQSCGR